MSTPPSPESPVAFVGEIERTLSAQLREHLGHSRQLPFGLDRALLDLFSRVESQRADFMPLLLQFVAPNRGSGTSTVCSGFAVACAMASHRPVLLLGTTAPEGTRSVLGTLSEQRGLHECIAPVQDVPQLYRASLSTGAQQTLQHTPTHDLEAVLNLFRERFAAVIIDAPALEGSSDALVLSRHCDGTVVVVRAEHTTRPSVRKALQDLERHGAEVLGTVLNERRSHLPGWMGRWLR